MSVDRSSEMRRSPRAGLARGVDRCLEPPITRHPRHAPTSAPTPATTATPTAPCRSVEWWPTAKPRPYEHNPRLIPQTAIDKVAASLAAYGFRQPLVVDTDGVIIVGHVRLLAARQLGLPEVPVHIAADLTAEQARAYRIADNRTAAESDWDLEVLPDEISALSEAGCELTPLGFDAAELARLELAVAPEGDEESIPEPPADPVTRPGDLWRLGPHRLLCGDATRGVDVVRLMDGQRASLMATDPPYLVDYDGGHHPASKSNGGAEGKDPDRHWDTYVDPESSVAFYRDYLQLALDEALIENAALYQWFAMLRSPLVFAAWQECGLRVHQVLIWKKSRAVLTHAHYLWDYEPCLYGWPSGHQPARKPPAETRTVWAIDSSIEDSPGAVHPTIKPLACFRRPIAYHTAPGELLYEPFAGSGTVLLAAEQLGRVCRALEREPAFCDVVIERWQRASGKQAVRHGR